MDAPLDPTPLLTFYPALTGQPVTPMAGGLINDTFAVGSDAVLQRLHRIFTPAVNLDIDALVPTLRAAGVPVPALIRTGEGALYVEVEAGPLTGCWRLMTRLPGRMIHRVTTDAVARVAGQTLARFHDALRSVDHTFQFTRPGAHDTDAHLARLAAVVTCWPRHRLYGPVATLAEALQARWAALGGESAGLPLRIVHGDPKVANLLFEGPDDAPTVSAVLDLDTMAWATLEVELGDALRSWCSLSTESDATASFNAGRFEAAVAGYVSVAGPWLLEAELSAFGPGTERIGLELAARFAADALEESYFGWDPTVAPARGEHNLLRARNQWALAESVAAQRDALEAITARLRR